MCTPFHRTLYASAAFFKRPQHPSSLGSFLPSHQPPNLHNPPPHPLVTLYSSSLPLVVASIPPEGTPTHTIIAPSPYLLNRLPAAATPLQPPSPAAPNTVHTSNFPSTGKPGFPLLPLDSQAPSFWDSLRVRERRCPGPGARYRQGYWCICTSANTCAHASYRCNTTIY